MTDAFSDHPDPCKRCGRARNLILAGYKYFARGYCCSFCERNIKPHSDLCALFNVVSGSRHEHAVVIDDVPSF